MFHNIKSKKMKKKISAMNLTPVTFKQPFLMIIAGPTMSGKSYLVCDLLSEPGYFEQFPKHVLWCYGTSDVSQMNYIEKKSKIPVTFISGMPEIDEIPSDSKTLIILDDLMTESGKSMEIADLFTREAHHNNISVILLVQNIFHKGIKMRDISLNASYIIIFKNPRDKRQIISLGCQIFPTDVKYLEDAYEQATERPHGYLLIDLTQHTKEHQRLATNIYPPHCCYHFISKQFIAKHGCLQ